MRAFFLFLTIAVAAWHSATCRAKDEVKTEYGPVVCHSVTFVDPPNKNARTWEGAVTRAINIRLPNDTTVCYDADRMTVASYWRGGFLDFSKTHHTSYKGNICPRPGATPVYEDLGGPMGHTSGGEPKHAVIRGYYLHDDRVVLSYNVGDRVVLESPTSFDEVVWRELLIRAGTDSFRIPLGTLTKSKVELRGNAANMVDGDRTLTLHIAGQTRGLNLQHDGDTVFVNVPARKDDLQFAVAMFSHDTEESGVHPLPEVPSKIGDPGQFAKAGARRWKETFTTEGKLGEQDGAYALDELPTPIRPYGSWMRLSAIDFFEDGRAAVATLPGDVWIVSWDVKDISKIHWQRFATGLYEPLGLKVVDGKIYVRGRDRITRLHDLNDDGEADFYENFHSHGPVGPGYHAFVFDLNTDEKGAFWFVKSGRKGPSIGEVIKLSPDGTKHEVIATHFRHPNGMGFGGPHNWVTIGDNADGKYPSGAMIVRKGQSYGWDGPQTEPYLYVVPPKVDTSPGSQCWTDTKRFGPLGGSIIHTSYSTSSISYVLTQDSSPHPSGYAIHMPYGFKSGPMRLRVSPRDGQMYIACQRGWDSNAAADGMIHRLRYTGQDAYLVTGAKATKAGVELTFACELDEKTADFDNFFAARVDGKSEKEVDIDDVELIDKQTVLVKFFEEDIDPSNIVDHEATKRAAKKGDDRTHYRVVAPLAITFNMKAKDGTPLKDTVYCTINGY